MKYTELTDSEKKKLINQYYYNENLSLKQIADKLGTYSNKIRRDAIRLNIKLRDKSEAQKNALETGIHKHPTKGQKRTENTKEKIGRSLVESWNTLSQDELNQRKQLAKINWENKSDNEKSNMLTKANQAVRLASKEGSKLEKFILQKLLADGYKVEFHKEQNLVNTRLQIDLFLPTINTAIEVDGPSHFSPVWGDDVLKRNISYDNKKTGLMLGKGLVVIRIKQTKDFSNSRALMIYDQLKAVIQQITKKFPSPDNRTINIGDN